MSCYRSDGVWRRWPHAGGLASALAALALSGALIAACGGSSTTSTSGTSNPSVAQLNDLLKAQNPATLLGGHPIIGTSNGQRLIGGPGANRIVALAPNETIVGGGGPDELGAYGSNATIVAGQGSAFIYAAGPHATLVSGSTPDLLVDTNNNGTIRLNGNGNEVLLSGQNDHVECMPTSHNDLIYDNRTDSVSSTCQTNGAHLASLDQGPTTVRGGSVAAGRTTASPVHGSGTSTDPYISDCDPNPDPDGNCLVSSFAPRSLSKFLQSETTLSYQCPAYAPYLVNQNYAPGGTSLHPGVEIREDTSDWHIGVVITGNHTLLVLPPDPNGDYRYAIGITGVDYLTSSATDWDNIFGETHTYQVVLHCTANKNRGY